MAVSLALERVYDPRKVEPEAYALWERSEAFRSTPDARPHEETFTIVIPPPNVTGALHLGHALNNTLQDILIRYHRMRGFNTLWQPGTDHAGIATQAVVERRIREQEGKTRRELGREELVKRIWQWKDDYEKRIISQLKLMGCSCDWARIRFTLDEGLARAVRHMFFKLFKDGLIFRGKRLVNWDTQLQTAVSDDEVYHEKVQGHFWHFKYPVIDPKPGEPEHVIIATTRPETMLGDTAVAVHPDPEGFFERMEAELRGLLNQLSGRPDGSGASKEEAETNAKLEALSARRQSHLDQLVKLRDMAKDGRKVMLPLVEREIPLITDEWADPTLGTGCVKITPAHDPNDYEVGVRHKLPMVNVLTPDGKIAPIVEPDGSTNRHRGDYEGLTFSKEGRDKVVADLEARGLIHEIEDHETEIGHSDRSKLPIEPYLSDQWFLQTSDRDVTLGDGKKAPGLAQAAIDAVDDGRIQIFPSRYAKSYLDWLGEKRDWCISRQLWWGHRIPIWSKRQSYAGAVHGRLELRIDEVSATAQGTGEGATDMSVLIGRLPGRCTRVMRDDGTLYAVGGAEDDYEQLVKLRDDQRTEDPLNWFVCLDHGTTFGTGNPLEDLLQADGFTREEDVLDTWFSSALWPFSTLGWPEKTGHVKQYYPGSVLCTSRDIITNWVARMVMFGLYAMGEVPFDRVYIHPKILDGRGETMSKSKGNGVDPVDVIHTHGADALRYSMADMTTETQDIRMPVEYVCPHCSQLVDQGAVLKVEEQARKSRGEKLERKLQPVDCTRVTCTHKECRKEFATQWADDALKKELGLGRETSDKFDIGRNFCNKLWNAARFAFMNLEGARCDRLDVAALAPEDRWILARLSQTIRRYHRCLQNYQFSASVRELREFFWDSLCDWYIELTKPRIATEPRASARADVGTSRDPRTAGHPSTGNGDAAKQVLAFCLDQTLRLWHPTIPFITEGLWGDLNKKVTRRGIPPIAELSEEPVLATAMFPPVDGYPGLEDEGILDVFAEIQQVVKAVRELRSQCGVSPKEAVKATVVLPQAECAAFQAHVHIVLRMANVSELSVDPHAKRPPNAGSVTMGSLRVFVHDISDDEAERARTSKALEALEKRIAGKSAKLANEKFVSGAKPQVVEAERSRLAELITQREGLEAHLASLTN